MAGLQSKIQIISNALLLLGGDTISSITENSTGSKLGANLFEGTYLDMLANHRWRFATKTLLLAKLTEKPDTGYNNAYQLPSDYEYIIKADARDYQIYGTELHANAETVKIDYIYRVEEDNLPASFAKALEYNLAAQFAIPLTGDIAKGTYFQRVYSDAIKKAKFIDSSQHPQQAVVSNPYTDVRY